MHFTTELKKRGEASSSGYVQKRKKKLKNIFTKFQLSAIIVLRFLFQSLDLSEISPTVLLLKFHFF